MGQEWCNWLLIGQEDISFLPLLMEASVDILEKNVILIAMEWKKPFFFFFFCEQENKIHLETRSCQQL